ncbi:chitobiase, partial [Vibrio furnissii]
LAHNALDWIVGLNPYDMCMLDGHGRNNPDYLPQLGFFNAKGGVCNGITAGFDNEQDIAFNPTPHDQDLLQNWRWGEQWIPHGAWYLLAIIHQ